MARVKCDSEWHAEARRRVERCDIDITRRSRKYGKVPVNELPFLRSLGTDWKETHQFN